MTRTRLALAAAASTLVLAGCQYWPRHKETVATAAPAAEEPVKVTVEETATMADTEACDVLESRGWEAWVNRMPGVAMVPTLHVAGKVDVRSGGYTFTWQEGPMDRSARPTLRLKLVAKAPDSMAISAITTEDVKYEAPANGLTFSGVLISCGGRTLGEITEIMDVQ